MQVAREKVSEVEAGMAAMKQSHLSIVLEMEEQYKAMETDMQVTISTHPKRGEKRKNPHAHDMPKCVSLTFFRTATNSHAND